MDFSSSILVTGGAGYIGSHVCKALYKAGYLPVVLDNLSQGHKEFVKWGPLEVADLLDQKRCKEIIAQYKPLAVMHFASKASVIESQKNPIKYYENNLLATCNLLKECVEQDINYFIFSSSCAVFGNPIHTPIRENDPKNPISVYGRSKKIIEEILQDFDQAYNIKSVSLRYFNAAGADLQGELGEIHEPETHLIPIALQTALFQREKMTVFGNDFPTTDGSAIRDYIHVEDLASAHLLALKYLIKENKSDVFHLGSGSGISVFEILKEIESITKLSINYQIASSRKGEPAMLVADSSKAKKILQWKATHSDVKTIVESAYLWHKQMQ